MNDAIEDLSSDDVQLLHEANAGYRGLTDQIGTAIVGQQEIVRALLAAIFSAGHVLVIGVPGLAKTLLVKTLAQVLGWKFHRIQFTPDLMPADIIGMELLQEDAQTGQRSMQFTPGPIFANMILADEINRTPPKTQAALLEAMQEYTVTSMGRSYPVEQPFIVIATQNPIEQEGTYPLPEAQLDRFMFSLWMDYPPVEDEEEIVLRTASTVAAIAPVFTKEQMIAYQALVHRLPVSRHVASYAVAIARATRPNSSEASPYVKRYVEWGAGPRAAQHLVLAGKAMAAIDAVPAVTAKHIRQVAGYVLRHRVIANYEATGEGINSAAIIERVLSEISEPQYAG